MHQCLHHPTFSMEPEKKLKERIPLRQNLSFSGPMLAFRSACSWPGYNRRRPREIAYFGPGRCMHFRFGGALCLSFMGRGDASIGSKCYGITEWTASVHTLHMPKPVDKIGWGKNQLQNSVNIRRKHWKCRKTYDHLCAPDHVVLPSLRWSVLQYLSELEYFTHPGSLWNQPMGCKSYPCGYDYSIKYMGDSPNYIFPKYHWVQPHLCTVYYCLGGISSMIS